MNGAEIIIAIQLVVIIALVLINFASGIRHNKERWNLLDRIMAKDTAEYLKLRETVDKLQVVKVDDLLNSIARGEKTDGGIPIGS